MKGRISIIAGIALLWTAVVAPFVLASQNALNLPTVGTLSGLQAVTDINNANDSLNTCNSGGAAPTNQLSGVPSAGNCWLNTSTNVLQYYDGTNWLVVGILDNANHIWTPIVGGNTATNVASAGTTNLCGASNASPVGAYLTITGTTTITSFGSNCVVGQLKYLTFNGALTLTYNAVSLIVPGSANITTAAGDIALAAYLGSGNWKVIVYQAQTGSFPGAVSLTAADQVLSGGANITSFGLGTFSSGTQTVDCGKNPGQFFTNGGAFTLAAPSNDGMCDLLDTNNASAGTITFSGFTVNSNTGEALTNTNTNKFIIHIERINGVSTYFVKALQ